MNHTTMYRCPGACRGVWHSPTNCGDKNCELYGKPLHEVKQCEPCAQAAERDGKNHACEGCEEC